MFSYIKITLILLFSLGLLTHVKNVKAQSGEKFFYAWIKTSNPAATLNLPDTLINTLNIDSVYCPFQLPELKNIWLIRSRTGFSKSSLYNISQLKNIAYAEPRIAFTSLTLPNDSLDQLWYLNDINSSNSWDYPVKRKIKVALIDDAFYIVHPDLWQNIYINNKEIRGNFIDDDSNGYIDDFMGFDVAESDSDVTPPLFAREYMHHGTHIAGIAGAVTQNNFGIASVSNNSALLIPVKAALVPEQITFAEEALEYAIRMDAQIINMSFGTTDTTGLSTFKRLLSIALNKGIQVIASAGNDGDEKKYFPAAWDSVISVGALKENNQMYPGSQYGSTIDIVTPGYNIYSTASGNTRYIKLSGTSMSSAMLTAALARVLSISTVLTTESALQCIYLTARNIESFNDVKYSMKMGKGALNLNEACNCGQNNGIVELPASYHNFIYPNPSYGNVNLINPHSVNLKYSVVTLSGSIIQHGYINKFETLHIQLPSGLFIIKFIWPDDSYSTHRLVILNSDDN